MVIVFGNQKGGAGKSTLATLFANQLSIAKKRDVLVLDMDHQRTISNWYKEDARLENVELYEVLELDLDKFGSIQYQLTQNKDQIVIIDLPGNLSDEAMVPIILATDVFITPFHYDKATYHATSVFNSVVHALNPKAKKFFIPNRLKANVRHETEELINEDLSKYGIVTNKIPDSVALQRVTTKDISPKVVTLIDEVFEQIFKEIL